MTFPSVARFFLQLFGAVGYMSTISLWLWAIVLWMPIVLNSNVMNTAISSQAPSRQAPVTAPELPSIASVLIAGTVTVVSVAIAAYVAVKLPGVAVQRSSEVLHVASTRIAPKIIQHKKVSKKKRLVVSGHIVMALKLCAVAAPLGALYAVVQYGVPLSTSIVWLVGSFLAYVAVVGFSVQWLLARFQRVEYSSLW